MKIKICYYTFLAVILFFSIFVEAADLHLKVLKNPGTSIIDGKIHFIYELVITNDGLNDVSVNEVSVDGKTLGTLTYTGSELHSRFKVLGTINYETLPDWLNPGTTPLPHPPGVIPAGRSALIFLQFAAAQKNTTIPLTIINKVVTFSAENNASQELMLTTVLENPMPLVLGAPFASGVWFPFNGPSDDSRHRRSVLRLFDQFYIAQRYAIDWMQIGQDGFLVKPETSSKENSSYVSYGAQVLAVADAVVEAITDDIPENLPESDTRAVTINLQTITGNSVLLKLSENRYALYAHLRPNSLNVKVGQTVKKGQVIGSLGNSGNSTAPHLHFHVCDGPSALQCQGIPYVFEKFNHQETSVEGENMQNLKFMGTGPLVPATHELTWNNRLIVF